MPCRHLIKGLALVSSGTHDPSPWEPMPHTRPDSRPRKMTGADLDLLVVEDNAGACRIVVELLRGAGFSGIAVAHSAEAAIGHMRQAKPDLLLLDWNLPGMSGLDLVRLIRASEAPPDAAAGDPPFAEPDLPVVMITGRQQAGDVAAARDAGVSDFVVKPFSTGSLLRALNRAMTRKAPVPPPSVTAEPNMTSPPQRRRKTASHFPGLLQRDTGDLMRAVRGELVALRARVQAGGHVDPTALDALSAQVSAAGAACGFIAVTIHSLNDYVRSCAMEGETGVLDQHLDALIRLCDRDGILS